MILFFKHYVETHYVETFAELYSVVRNQFRQNVL